MTDLIPIKDSIGLLRDLKTNSIINVNKFQYNNYMKLKEQKEKEKENYSNIEEDLLKVKSDIDEIKDLLRRLIDEPR